MEVEHEYQKNGWELEAWVVIDYAGCKRTRKSMSGGAIRFGSHLIKAWAVTQSLVALHGELLIF